MEGMYAMGVEHLCLPALSQRRLCPPAGGGKARTPSVTLLRGGAPRLGKGPLHLWLKHLLHLSAHAQVLGTKSSRVRASQLDSPEEPGAKRKKN